MSLATLRPNYALKVPILKTYMRIPRFLNAYVVNGSGKNRG